MNTPLPLISFDWAIKRLLRQKANYGILEGFLSELLLQDITISHIAESQSNSDDDEDKLNQVDILCESSTGEMFLIELQYNSERDYFHRMNFGTSKIITDYMKLGYDYAQLKKVYSINIVYFELGHGADYVYYGKTEFRGIHVDDVLQVTEQQKALFNKENEYEIFPEYYIIKVNKFDKVSKSTFDERVYYLKNNSLPEGYRAKGLNEVAQKLKEDSMTDDEKIKYQKHLKSQAIAQSEITTAMNDGIEIGREEGREEEKIIQEKIRAKERNEQDLKLKSIILNLKSNGMDNDSISNIMNISIADIERLIDL
jgi:predicted transposase/invertase (TIGR01784 family)